MDDLNAKVALLQSALDKLLEERDELDIEIRKHEGALLPLRRMPTEILSLIFPMALRLSESAPWTVSAVCARWRTIVVSQPRFWVSIGHSDLNRISSIRLETQLRRSAELPLNVNFTVDHTFYHPSAEIRDLEFRNLEIICKHAARWEIFSMSAPEVLFDRLQACVQDQLARLRELTIEMEYDGDDLGDDVPSLDVFSDAPLLQRVVVNKSLWNYPLTMVLPWSQILRYSGTNTWDGHLVALRAATNLVHCSLEICQESSVPQIPIFLPHLLRLSLSNPAFLKCLDTPALVELCCDYAPPVLPFLHRQRCKLQSLIMWESSTPADPTDLTYIIDAIPTVATLGLVFPLPAAFFFDLHSRPSMAPALECISTILDDSPAVQNQFVQAMESRGRLKSVEVQSPVFAPGILERMQLLRSRGMEFGFNVSGWHFGFLYLVVPKDLWIETED
jgi:hypothetical protein